jgi:biopolymer transport protein ExbD
MLTPADWQGRGREEWSKDLSRCDVYIYREKHRRQKEAAMRRKTKHNETMKLEMTPMIDVVFLLLIFFVITSRPQDVIGDLNANTEKPGLCVSAVRVPLVVAVERDGYSVDGIRCDRLGLEARLHGIAARSIDHAIRAVVQPDSSHGQLVAVLDICAAAHLTNVSMSVGRARE